MILKFQTNDALLLSRQLVGLAQFSKAGYFKNHGENLGHVLEKLFTSVIFRCPDETNVAQLGLLHNDTKAARRRAATSLIKIGMKVPDKLYTLFPDLIGRVIALMEQKQILDAEKALLYEMLVIVSNSKPNFEGPKNVCGPDVGAATERLEFTGVKGNHIFAAKTDRNASGF